jgi:uncharacterized protein YwgA
MTRRDWLLLMCAYHGAPAGLDPVRLQKGMFLFARTHPLSVDQQYRFKPYDYGPMSPTIYRDLDDLVDLGLLTRHPVPGKRWSRYAATDLGRTMAEKRLRQLSEQDKAAARRLYEIKQRVATTSFQRAARERLPRPSGYGRQLGLPAIELTTAAIVPSQRRPH